MINIFEEAKKKRYKDINNTIIYLKTRQNIPFFLRAKRGGQVAKYKEYTHIKS